MFSWKRWTSTKIGRLEISKKLWLNSNMETQYYPPWAKQEENGLVLSRGDFWMIWRCHSIPCFHFYFLFRNNGIREQLYQNDFCCCYGEICFESVIPQVLDHSYVQSSFSTITRHLDNGIWKTPSSWRFYRHGST